MRRALLAACAASILGSAPAAMARSAATMSYPSAEVWPTAVRFLRVDRGFPIKERDEAAGYVLFDYVDRERSYGGSLELIKVTDSEGRPSTSVVINIGDLPRHHEILLLDKLQAKLKQERGAPSAPPPRKQPPAEDKDKSADKSKPDDKKKDEGPSLEYYRGS